MPVFAALISASRPAPELLMLLNKSWTVLSPLTLIV